MNYRDEKLEDEIKQVMEDTKMDYMQAYYHVRQRRALAAMPVPFALGKAAVFE